MTEIIALKKTCEHCSTEFSITQGDLDFYNKISPTFAGKKYQIPTPKLCPDCRQRRRLAFRNERKLYIRECDASKKRIISIYSPDKSYKVYDQDIWRTKIWDPMDFGRDFDFSKTFTENYKQLLDAIPLIGSNVLNSENSTYNNYLKDSRNCYMTFGGVDNESCFYSREVRGCNQVLDCSTLQNSQNCSNINFGYNNYNVHYGYNVNNSVDSYFLLHCDGCKNCIACSGLENKQYCVFNKQLTKSEYKKLLESFDYEQYCGRYYNEVKYNNVVPSIGSENIIESKYIKYSQNIAYSTSLSNSKNCKYCRECSNAQDSQDCGPGMPNLVYEGTTTGANTHCIAINTVNGMDSVYYCIMGTNSTHLFGCSALHNKQYCILNKQYTKEEYEQLVPKIIEHMKKTGERGEFFHPSLSPFGYNETVAQEYYPSDKESVAKFGYKWSDYEASTPQVEKVILGKELPREGCKDLDQKDSEYLKDILKYAIKCEVSGKLFRLIPQEIEFYKRHNLSLPSKHPDVRHQERMALRK